MHDLHVILGIHYTIDPYTGTCDAPATIGIGDLYAKSHGDNTLVMQTALDFFHVTNAQIQYVGTVINTILFYSLFYTAQLVINILGLQ